MAVTVCLTSAMPAARSVAQDPDVSTRAVVAAAVRYVGAYREDFAFLIADETSRQSVHRPGSVRARERLMRGELYLAWLPADEAWIAVHDVADVDGAPVEDREDLAALIRSGAELRGIARQVAARNARFNIGSVQRNFNEPMLPLLLLDEARIDDVAFDRRAVVTAGGVTLVTLAFRERDERPLVRGTAGRLRGRGEFVVEAGSGRVRSSWFELREGPVLARLTTRYERDPKLDLWVPASFEELYQTTDRGRVTETILGTAAYTNYRRFVGVGRIKR
jgi:hypothetical protein